MDSITCQEKVPHSPKVKSERRQYLLLGQRKGLPLSFLAFTASYTYPPVYFLTMSISLKSLFDGFPLHRTR